MAREDNSSAPAFKQQKLAGWEGTAKTYDDYAGKSRYGWSNQC